MSEIVGSSFWLLCMCCVFSCWFAICFVSQTWVCECFITKRAIHTSLVAIFQVNMAQPLPVLYVIVFLCLFRTCVSQQLEPKLFISLTHIMSFSVVPFLTPSNSILVLYLIQSVLSSVKRLCVYVLSSHFLLTYSRLIILD